MVKTESIRMATRGMAEELRSMKIGEVVRFPFDKYNYSSVRSTISVTLIHERAKGKRWRTHANIDEKSTDVTRIA